MALKEDEAYWQEKCECGHARENHVVGGDCMGSWMRVAGSMGGVAVPCSCTQFTPKSEIRRTAVLEFTFTYDWQYGAGGHDFGSGENTESIEAPSLQDALNRLDQMLPKKYGFEVSELRVQFEGKTLWFIPGESLKTKWFSDATLWR